MKKLSKYVAVAIFGFIALHSGAQEIKQEIKKEVKIKEVNGEKVVTINTNENGKETQEEYKGEAAEKKIVEIQQGNSPDEVKEEVRIEEINGEKTVFVTKTVGGVSTTEVYKGDAAIAKEKEYESRGVPSNQPKQLKSSTKRIEVKKIENGEN